MNITSGIVGNSLQRAIINFPQVNFFISIIENQKTESCDPRDGMERSNGRLRVLFNWRDRYWEVRHRCQVASSNSKFKVAVCATDGFTVRPEGH